MYLLQQLKRENLRYVPQLNFSQNPDNNHSLSDSNFDGSDIDDLSML